MQGIEGRHPANNNPDKPSLPTGADLVRAGLVKVDPCPTCVGPMREAVRNITQGLQVLSGSDSKSL